MDGDADDFALERVTESFVIGGHPRAVTWSWQRWSGAPTRAAPGTRNMPRV